MCTLSMVPADSGLIITMNRDERRDRLEGEPRLLAETGSLQCWYGLDCAAGGSWFGVNAAGLVAMLMNRYPQESGFVAQRSRGELVPKVLACETTEQILAALQDDDWSAFAPFDLLLVLHGQMHRLSWDGAHLLHARQPLDAPLLLISSSIDYAAALAWRRQAFANFLAENPEPDAGSLLQLHQQPCPENPSLGICMQREHSHTKSICQAVLSPDAIRARYLPVETLNSNTAGEDWHVCW